MIGESHTHEGVQADGDEIVIDDGDEIAHETPDADDIVNAAQEALDTCYDEHMKVPDLLAHVELVLDAEEGSLHQWTNYFGKLIRERKPKSDSGAFSLSWANKTALPAPTPRYRPPAAKVWDGRAQPVHDQKGKIVSYQGAWVSVEGPSQAPTSNAKNRPIGRPRSGMQWDTTEGKWLPQTNQADDSDGLNEDSVESDKRSKVMSNPYLLTRLHARTHT